MTTKERRPNLFVDALKLISECIEHLHDADLSDEEQKSRELLFDYCELLRKRRKTPNYGKFKRRKPRGSKQ